MCSRNIGSALCFDLCVLRDLIWYLELTGCICWSFCPLAEASLAAPGRTEPPAFGPPASLWVKLRSPGLRGGSTCRRG